MKEGKKRCIKTNTRKKQLNPLIKMKSTAENTLGGSVS